MSRILKRGMELDESIIGRLWRIIDRPMLLERIEFEYIAKYGECRHETILAELSNLETDGKIKRIKQGVYEP